MDNIRSGTTIRQPSTANLMIDSGDRTSGTSSDFSISKQQNILSGFFTRFGVVEICIDWCIDNISGEFSNNVFQVVVSGPAAFTYTATFGNGTYTVAEALNYIKNELNAAALANPMPGPIGPVTFALSIDPTVVVAGVGKQWLLCLNAVGAVTDYQITPSNLQYQLDVAPIEPGTGHRFTCPSLIPYKYLDFTCPAITYQQGLKDATTSRSDRDVLYRWYMAWDEAPTFDQYGYPILQGYTAFRARRYLSYPKQVKWDSQQPIGQLIFQVYGAYPDRGSTQDGKVEILSTAGDQEFDFQMTLLVSEQ